MSTGVERLGNSGAIDTYFMIKNKNGVRNFARGLTRSLSLPRREITLENRRILNSIAFRRRSVGGSPLLIAPVNVYLGCCSREGGFVVIEFGNREVGLCSGGELAVISTTLRTKFPGSRLFPGHNAPVGFAMGNITELMENRTKSNTIIAVGKGPTDVGAPLRPGDRVIVRPSATKRTTICGVSRLSRCGRSIVAFVVGNEEISYPEFIRMGKRLRPRSCDVERGSIVRAEGCCAIHRVTRFVSLIVSASRVVFMGGRRTSLSALMCRGFSIR